MTTINIKKDYSYQNLPVLQELIRTSWNLKSVIISYNYRVIPDEIRPDTWPLRLKFEILGCDTLEIRILSLTVGLNDQNAQCTAEILQFLGVSYDDEDIFTRRKEGADGYIRLFYTP